MRIKFPLLIFVCTAILFQSCGIKARIKKADKRFEIGEYYAAGELYRNIYSEISNDKPLKARIAFRQAECFRLTNQGRAEQPYLNAIRYNYPESIVLFRCAQILYQNGKYADAIKYYTQFLKKDSMNVVARNGLYAAKNIAELKKNPTKYVVKRSTEFNLRRSSSFSPAYAGFNSDMIVFTSTRPADKKIVQKNSRITGLPLNHIYFSRKNVAGKWETPEAIDGSVNSSDDEGVCSITADGKIMYYTYSPNVETGFNSTEILMSNRIGGTWSRPQKVNIFNDSTISVAHPAISPDGMTLYFVSDSPKGLGGKDIWKGTITNGECKNIENLGPEINTSGDEMFPTVDADGTLYFSSNGRIGFGGLDIYKATPKKDGGWLVENMGQPINSSADDFGIAFDGKLKKGYFSSSRNETKGVDAIWSFELPELAYSVEGKITDEKGVIIPEATVRLVSNTGVNANIQSKKDGTYRFKLDKDMECVMQVSARGYLNQQNSVSTKGLTESKTFTVNFKLTPISKPIQIENIFYESGKWDLTPASEAGLQVLAKVLTDNPNITIEISANTDYVGNAESNKSLSEKRAKSVVTYLISKGIAADRLTSVGNGKEKPVVVDVALAKKYTFLKENDVLTESYILKLTSEQQGIANQINRRTEFRVVKTTYKLY